MARKTQYQPTKRQGVDLSAAQEIHYNKEFKAADIAGGYRKRQKEQLHNQ